MLKKTQILLGSALMVAVPFSGSLHADEAATAVPAAAETQSASEDAPKAEPEVSESDLLGMVGFLTAQGGGVASLELEAAGIRALAKGLHQSLIGEANLMDLPREEVEAAFNQAQARAEAAQAETEGETTLPEVSESALEKIGVVMAMQSGLQELGFSAAEAELIKAGFIEGASATEMDPDMEAKMPAFRAFVQGRAQAAQSAAQEAQAGAAKGNIDAGKAFIEALAKEEGVESSKTGLHYKILDPGGDEKPAMTDSVLVHYKGTRIDGTEFDSSYKRGEPAEFPLNRVVAGFGEGLTKIGEGGKIILYIPSDLGYGDSPRPGGVIQPGDTLIFECELIEINPGK